jgi:hypothetical protein
MRDANRAKVAGVLNAYCGGLKTSRIALTFRRSVFSAPHSFVTAMITLNAYQH